jgi:hypothetical protein
MVETEQVKLHDLNAFEVSGSDSNSSPPKSIKIVRVKFERYGDDLAIIATDTLLDEVEGSDNLDS